MHRLVNPGKALRTLRKTPAILAAVLEGLTQEQAVLLRDPSAGADEERWNILYIICHLRDIEALYAMRVRDLLDRPDPTFTLVTNEELIARGNYDAQEWREVLDDYLARRRALIELLESLRDAQWLLTGTHPTQGPATLLDVAVNIGLHDVDHIEQIIRCLATSSRL
jgi:hypothetical protein